ncbi:MAG TPA: hypothetical protein VK585_01880 [Jiangellaceae bacterium]|nr:hypothetical protein [Jiangellaceae bacterium]
MVGLPGELSNMTPPTVCLLVLTVGQVAAVVLARPWMQRWLSRPRPWTAVVTVGSAAMTIHLWHLSVLVGPWSSTLLMVPVDPLQDTFCVAAGLLLVRRAVRAGPGPGRLGTCS